jgi:hypothetical protein
MGIINRLRGTEGGKQPTRTVVAAAMPMSGPGVKAVDRGRRHSTTEQWQQEAWYYFDAIGEARGPMVWIANAVSQADLHATELDLETGTPTGPADDPMAVAAANMVLGGPAMRAGLLRLIALCWQVPGEGWIVIRPRPALRGKPQPDQWLVLSGDKVRAKGTSWTYTDPFTLLTVTLGEQDRMMRLWSPHPNDQAKADSAMRPALPICREIEKASQNIAARLDSRIATNGLLVLADELSLSGDDFMAQFMDVAEMGLKNPGQASSQVPFAFNAPAEFIANGGAVAHVDLGTQFDASVVELRQDGLRRLASTLDMPKDVAEGTQGEANHWSAWQVEESTYKIFIEPLLKAVGDAITEHWYRPALIAMGMLAENAERFELGWDTTAIVARPDDRETLESLYDKVLISDAYMLAENGVPEDAMPDATERTRRVLEKIVLGAPTLLADPNVAEALGLDIEVSPVAAGVDAEVGAGGELEVPEPPAPVVNALPGTQGEEPVPEGLVAAAELIVYDALSRAGGRLLTNQNRGQFKSTPRHELHTVIPYNDRAQTPSDLLEGSFQFIFPVAEAFGLDGQSLSDQLALYCRHRVLEGRPHSRTAMLEYLADVDRA